MSTFDPNYVSQEFCLASQGYLSTPSCRLQEFLGRLPRAVSLREKAIVAAVKDGIARPRQWDEGRAPLRLRRRPGAGEHWWR